MAETLNAFGHEKDFKKLLIIGGEIWFNLAKNLEESKVCSSKNCRKK